MPHIKAFPFQQLDSRLYKPKFSKNEMVSQLKSTSSLRLYIYEKMSLDGVMLNHMK